MAWSFSIKHVSVIFSDSHFCTDDMSVIQVIAHGRLRWCGLHRSHLEESVTFPHSYLANHGVSQYLLADAFSGATVKSWYMRGFSWQDEEHGTLWIPVRMVSCSPPCVFPMQSCYPVLLSQRASCPDSTQHYHCLTPSGQVLGHGRAQVHKVQL